MANPLDEVALEYIASRNEELLERIIKKSEGLVKYFAVLYGGGCCLDDLLQAGRIGLIKALRNYNQDREISFVTYASHCIIGEIRHYVRKEASFYRPGCIAELQYKVDKVIEDYTKEYGDVPSTQYIAGKLNIKEESVVEVMKAGFVSFEEIDHSKIKNSTYESFRLPVEDKIVLFNAIKKLSDIQRKVIQMLFLKDMTQQQVASELGMSQRQVSRVKEKSFQLLRKNMKE